jgi:hypothetical protein
MWCEGEWFYIKNHVDSAPCFTDQEPVLMDDRNRGAEPSLKGEVEPLLMTLETLKEQGLTCARLVYVVMHCRIQPLMDHWRPMYKYSGVNDPDRHSSEPLALSNIEARVKVVTALSS